MLTTGSLGFPIFQAYDLTTCQFTWSKYLPINLEKRNIAIAYRSDMLTNVAFTFVSKPKTITLG
jgi:hypothetical protein